MRIGIPRALLYYYYYPLWKTLFEQLGHEVVLSDETNAGIITEGAKATVSEFCVPIKIFNGHVLNLLEKDVDYIFVPQFLSMGREWYCPKFLGIDSITAYSVEGLKEKLLFMTVTGKDDAISRLSDYLPLCGPLGVTRGRMKRALCAAEERFARFRSLCREGYTIPEAYETLDGHPAEKPGGNGEVKIALLGYVNNIYDNFVSMNAVKRLRGLDADVVTFDMLDERLLENGPGKQPYWVFARKIYNAERYLMAQGGIDGVIHLTAFGCGPDSVIGKLMELDCDAAGVPFMTLRVDEHTGESHVQTRLEAFTDMLKMRKRRIKTV